MADEVEAEAAEEGDRIPLGGGRQPLGLEAGEDEGVDGIANPVRLADGRESWTTNRLQRPPVPPRPVLRREAKRIDGIAAPLGASGDPLTQQFLLGLRERFLRRHLTVMYPLVQGAVLRFAHHHGGKSGLAARQIQAALGLWP